MMVQILYNMEGRPAAGSPAKFSDVTAGAWYADAIAWASAHGIVTGYDNGAFGVNDYITREQMAAILYRYAEYKGKDVSGSAALDFADAGQVSAYAQAPVKWAVSEGLLNGRTSTTLEPKGTATRAEVATIIERYCSR